jgi:hypothetical protein
MKNFIYFIGWLLKRMFSGVIRVYYNYDKMVVKEPALASMPTFMFSIVVFAIVTVTVANISDSLKITLYSGFLSIAIVFVNYFRILLREQYGKYMREQDTFVDTLKGRD